MERHARSLEATGLANRWNLPGELVLYAGSSRSLATLELVVHRASIKPASRYRVMVLSVPDDDRIFHQVHIADLPADWRRITAYTALQDLGSAWYREGRFLLLKVPSAIIPQEINYIINTRHPDFASSVRLVRTEPYFWDDRLL